MEKSDFKIAHYIDVNVPIATCNFRCHYCYITQQYLFSSQLPKFKHTPAQMAQAFSKERLGGICVINLCANGETLLAPEMPEIIRALLYAGHIILVVTNGSISKAFDEFAKFPQELRKRLFIKFSFQYLELIRLKLLDKFFDNLQKMKSNCISFSLEITPCDELIPHIEDIKKISIERAGALPHITVARNNADPDLPVLTNLSREEYKKIWSQFDSALFEFKESVFGIKQTDFCYGGQATYTTSLDSGILKQCYNEKKLMNLYFNVNRSVIEKPIGCNCHAPHCWNAHFWMGFGTVPSKNETTPFYLEQRNRVCKDGSEWVVGDVKKAFTTRAEVGMSVFDRKVMKLSKIIEDRLLSVIKKNSKTFKCVFLDLPYYTNIGDILIWHGTENFIKHTGLKCFYRSSFLTFSRKKMQNISCNETLILLQGGGNFGDLWENNQNFRREIIRNYPDNPIIILPQTVFYINNDKLKFDAQLFAKHKKLTICARDNKSYQILKENFQNEVILVPDMAFHIPTDELKKFHAKQENKTLFLKRNDKELNDAIDYSKIIPETEIDIRDWPSMGKRMISSYFMRIFLSVNRRTSNLFSFFTDIYASYFFKPSLIKIGVKFIGKYNKVYTTRLHGAILCFLLEKPCVFFDNSYGKNNAFFETWLSDSGEIIFFSSPPPPPHERIAVFIFIYTGYADAAA
jgi:exopolysaccharide biosynthesis predicted pyruvyltransferase EpsI